MILEFCRAGQLYVPLTRLDLIQKYRSDGCGPAPVLTGSLQQWARPRRACARHARYDGELLKLYAERTTRWELHSQRITSFKRSLKTHSTIETDDRHLRFGPSSMTWNRTPMDRLLCGDVGYGRPK